MQIYYNPESSVEPEGAKLYAISYRGSDEKPRLITHSFQYQDTNQMVAPVLVFSDPGDAALVLKDVQSRTRTDRSETKHFWQLGNRVPSYPEAKIVAFNASEIRPV